MDIKKEIIRWSDLILEILLSYREKNPTFTFWLRQQDSPKSEELRLEQGYWFQGSDYIFVAFYKKGDVNRTKTIGLVISVVGCSNPNALPAYFDDFRLHPLNTTVWTNQINAMVLRNNVDVKISEMNINWLINLNCFNKRLLDNV